MLGPLAATAVATASVRARRDRTVAVAQLVRASDCGSEGRGFEPRHSPFQTPASSGVFDFNTSTISFGGGFGGVGSAA